MIVPNSGAKESENPTLMTRQPSSDTMMFYPSNSGEPADMPPLDYDMLRNFEFDMDDMWNGVYSTFDNI